MGSDSLARQEIDLRSKWLSEWTGQVTRVEPATGSTTGVPDTFLINAKSAGWLEFKVVGNGGTFEIRTPQRRWHRHFMEYSTASGFCILSTQGFWLINSRAAIEGQHVVGDCLPWDSAPGL